MKRKQGISREAIIIPALLVLIMIVVHIMHMPGCHGIIPRYGQGLKGILLAPLFHADWEHLFNNAIPILVMGFMVFSFYRRVAYLLLTLGWILTGTMVWLFGDIGFLQSDGHVGCHIGASGIVYMMVAFVLFSGFFRKSIPLIAVSLIVVFLYGSMLWGIFPEEVIVYTREQSSISWESHMAGMLVGIFFAYTWRNIGPTPQPNRYRWKQTPYDHIQDEALWQRYLEEFPEEEDQPTKPKKPPFKDLF